MTSSFPLLVFCDINDNFVEAARVTFGDEYRGIQIQYVIGDISLLRCDNTVYVSPANSLFLYRGGVDGVYASMFSGLEKQAQIHIKRFRYSTTQDRYYCPIGSAALISVTHGTSPVSNNYVLATPTMAAMAERLRNGDNIVKAAGAAFHLVNKYNSDPASAHKICKVVMPGMGTGVGGLSAEDSVFAIKTALDLFIDNQVQDSCGSRFAWVG